jgi:hypothetical protein
MAEGDDLDTTGIPDLDAGAPSKRLTGDGGQLLGENEDLDSEGIPDLDGALAQKEITGDAQEGMVPPRNYKQAPDDYWHRDTLEERLREETPDRIRVDDQQVRLIDDEADTGIDLDSELGDEGGAPSAEEAAMQVVDELPGGVDTDIDSYTGEKVDKLE